MLKIIKFRTMKRVFKIITIFSIVAIGKAHSANTCLPYLHFRLHIH